MTMQPVFPHDPGVRTMQAQGGAQFQLNQTMIQWKAIVIDYEKQVEIVANADARYLLGKKQWVRDAQTRDPKLSSAKANDWADTDDDVAEAMLEYKIESARLDAMKQKLKWLEAEYNRLRTAVVNEREESRLDSRHQPG